MNGDWHDRLSQPRFAVRVEKDVFVRMRDGTRIAADVYRPDAPGRFPALLGLSPYSKDVQKLPIFEYPTNRDVGNGGIESGDTEYFVSRGYVHVIAEARGTGMSEGSYRVFTEEEQRDGYDLVEWMAAQSWCDGNVGMLGMSYLGIMQFLVAAQNPPHLKAIFPVDAATDIYRHWSYHGGILHLSFLATWWDASLVVNRAGEVDVPQAELKASVAELLEQPDIRSYPRLYKTLRWPDKNPHLFDVLVHPFDGPFYWERSASTKFDKIRIPCFVLSRWASSYLHLPGAFSAFNGVRGPKKMMITVPESGVGFNRPWHENHDLILRWYDHWLKGNDTGIMDEPPIRILVQGTNAWREEREWPLARTRWTRFYLHANAGLSGDAPGWNERPDRFDNAVGLQPGGKVPGLEFRTDPLPADTELTGPMALVLYASIDTPDTSWYVELHDMAPDGASKRVSVGWLKASHREIDPERSKPYQPFHPHIRAIPVEPGRVCEYAIDLREASQVVKVGHRLVLLVKAQDAAWEGSRYRSVNHLPPSVSTRHTVQHTMEYPSHLLLPIIPATG